MLELQPRARITGEVSYKALEMHRGAVVEGKLCPMGDSHLLGHSEEKPILKLAANNQ
jgi:cytoskeletal protein CcmA (bactofilin family)